ncbi:MAG: ABC transporter ATP-binding protein, partial [Clostridia bacterium]|nr:ABC transporter ATP-binding protein [Clostridia bacterium]
MQDKTYKTGTLLKRFLPYYKKHIVTIIFDLFCASLTTVCEIVLPLIMKNITNAAIYDIASLTVSYVVSLGVLYIALRIIDGAAYYYMAYIGHVMG